MPQLPDDIDLRSEEANDFLSAPPSWLVRSGTGVMFATLMGVLGLTWLVKYPDVLSARVALSTTMPPVPIVSKSQGTISAILMPDSAAVKNGDLLAVIDNSAYYKDVLALDESLVGLLVASPEQLLAQRLPRGGRLGELLAPYSEAIKYYEDFAFYMGSQNSARLQGDYAQQILKYLALNDTIQQQSVFLDKEVGLAKLAQARVEGLYKNGTAEAKAAVEREEQNVARLQGQQKMLSEKLATNQLRIEEIKKEIGDAKFEGIEIVAEKQRVLRESLLALKSAIERWKQNYLLVAPTAGILTYNLKGNLLHSFVPMGQVVFTVIPGDLTTDIIAQGTLPGQNSGKAMLGNRVRIKLDGYDYREMGVLEGKLTEIAPIFDADGNAKVKISLKDGLVTTYHKTIAFRHEMPATAEIITDDRRLIERMFSF